MPEGAALPLLGSHVPDSCTPTMGARLWTCNGVSSAGWMAQEPPTTEDTAPAASHTPCQNIVCNMCYEVFMMNGIVFVEHVCPESAMQGSNCIDMPEAQNKATTCYKPQVDQCELATTDAIS